MLSEYLVNKKHLSKYLTLTGVTMFLHYLLSTSGKLKTQAWSQTGMLVFTSQL